MEMTSPSLATMSAESLRTMPVIYAVDELQNPHPLSRTTMLFEGARNSTGARNGVCRNK